MVKFYQLLSGHLIKKFRTCVLLSRFERVTADKKPLSALSRCTVQIDQITKGLLKLIGPFFVVIIQAFGTNP